VQFYGYTADPSRTPRHNAYVRMSNMPLFDYWNRPTNRAFHNLTSFLPPPPNLRSLLGLGLGFIPTPFRPTSLKTLLEDDNGGFLHLERSLRLKFFFTAVAQNDPDPAPNWNPKLHVRSDWMPPDKFFPDLMLRRLRNFTVKMAQLFRRKKSVPNLSRVHRNALEYLKSQSDFIIATCDKNLGPAIIERDKYIELAFRDHLNDSSTYQRLSIEEASLHLFENRSRLDKWLEDHKEELTDQEHTFVSSKSQDIEDPLPYFYLLMKVHKTPLKTRPIVSYSGSLFHALGVWTDTYLQSVAKSFRSYLKSSFDLVTKFKTFRLPSGRRCRLFTADATSMYTNIDTDAALSAIYDYILNNQNKFPTLPLTPLMEALEMIMKRNVFQFGDTFWLQLIGVAMGAPPAPSIATVSFATHEEKILDKFDNYLGLYKRYIDDVFGVWICDSDPAKDERKWRRFVRLLNDWHGLEWKVSDRSDTAIFLDLTLQIDGSVITSTIYEKVNNLHLYLPARSAHPPGVLYGLVAGSVYRALSLCSDPSDAQNHLQQLWRHLRARGYSLSALKPLFTKALRNYRNRDQTSTSATSSDYWFFKLNYHPQDPSSRLIQDAWNNTVAAPRLSKPLKDIDLMFKPIGHRRFIVCYRRFPTLGNLLSYRKLLPTSGRSVSSFTEEL